MASRKTSSVIERGRFRGFSLIELVIVLLLVGMLAVFAIPRLTRSQSITLPAVAAQVAANIRYTQNLSMSQGQRYRINFTANSYQITDMAGVGITQPVVGGTAPVVISGVVLSGYNPPLTNNYVAFDTMGIPYTSATALLAATATITLTAGADTSSVAIVAETGRVR